MPRNIYERLILRKFAAGQNPLADGNADYVVDRLIQARDRLRLAGLVEWNRNVLTPEGERAAKEAA